MSECQKTRAKSCPPCPLPSPQGSQQKDNRSLTGSQEGVHFHMEMWVSGSHKIRAMGEGGKMNCGISAPEDP